jgi:hypothetical protein
MRGVWSGTWDRDRQPWSVEIEPDCFTTKEGSVVSLYVESGDEPGSGLVGLMPEQAREIAQHILKVADLVEELRK